MHNSLKNTKILVVGGSSGIGLSVAKQASERGAKVVIASRNAAENHNELAVAVGDEIETYSFDATSELETETALREIGDFDHLVITVRPDITPVPLNKRI